MLRGNASLYRTLYRTVYSIHLPEPCWSLPQLESCIRAWCDFYSVFSSEAVSAVCYRPSWENVDTEGRIGARVQCPACHRWEWPSRLNVGFSSSSAFSPRCWSRLNQSLMAVKSPDGSKSRSTAWRKFWRFFYFYLWFRWYIYIIDMCASLKLFFKYINCIIFKTKVQYVFLQYRDRFLM